MGQLSSLLSCRFWERKLHLCNYPCQKPSGAQPPLEAGSALTALIGGARAEPERPGRADAQQRR